MGVSINGGTPIAGSGWFVKIIRGNLLDDFGVPLFLETSWNLHIHLHGTISGPAEFFRVQMRCIHIVYESYRYNAGTKQAFWPWWWMTGNHLIMSQHRKKKVIWLSGWVWIKVGWLTFHIIEHEMLNTFKNPWHGPLLAPFQIVEPSKEPLPPASNPNWGNPTPLQFLPVLPGPAWQGCVEIDDRPLAQQAFSARLEAFDPRLRLGDMLPAVIVCLEVICFFPPQLSRIYTNQFSVQSRQSVVECFTVTILKLQKSWNHQIYPNLMLGLCKNHLRLKFQLQFQTCQHIVKYSQPTSTAPPLLLGPRTRKRPPPGRQPRPVASRRAGRAMVQTWTARASALRPWGFSRGNPQSSTITKKPWPRKSLFLEQHGLEASSGRFRWREWTCWPLFVEVLQELIPSSGLFCVSSGTQWRGEPRCIMESQKQWVVWPSWHFQHRNMTDGQKCFFFFLQGLPTQGNVYFNRITYSWVIQKFSWRCQITGAGRRLPRNSNFFDREQSLQSVPFVHLSTSAISRMVLFGTLFTIQYRDAAFDSTSGHLPLVEVQPANHASNKELGELLGWVGWYTWYTTIMKMRKVRWVYLKKIKNRYVGASPASPCTSLAGPWS